MGTNKEMTQTGDNKEETIVGDNTRLFLISEIETEYKTQANQHTLAHYLVIP